MCGLICCILRFLTNRVSLITELVMKWHFLFRPEPMAPPRCSWLVVMDTSMLLSIYSNDVRPTSSKPVQVSRLLFLSNKHNLCNVNDVVIDFCFSLFLSLMQWLLMEKRLKEHRPYGWRLRLAMSLLSASWYKEELPSIVPQKPTQRHYERLVLTAIMK